MRRTFSLPEDRSVIEMTEIVQAPLERAWVARYEPLYVAQWWMPMGYTNPIVELDVVPGGRWRIVQRDPEGNEFAFYGTYSSVEPNLRTVQTFVSELFPDVTTHITTEFSEVPRGTQIVTTHAFAEEFQRRGYMNMGGVERMAEASVLYDRLLHKLARTR
jgi:uncharacterized protein YndB with AHSA1/START domain